MIQPRMPVIIEKADWPVWLGEVEDDVPARSAQRRENVLRLWLAKRARRSNGSAIKLLVFGNFCARRHVERRAFLHHQAAIERKVIPVGVANEIHSVEVPVLEIHVMDIVTACTKSPLPGKAKRKPEKTRLAA